MVERVQPERMGVCRNVIRSGFVGRDGQRHDVLGSVIQTIESKVFFEELPGRFQIRRSIIHFHKQIWYERDAERLGDVHEHGLGGDTAGDFRDPAP